MDEGGPGRGLVRRFGNRRTSGEVDEGGTGFEMDMAGRCKQREQPERPKSCGPIPRTGGTTGARREPYTEWTADESAEVKMATATKEDKVVGEATLGSLAKDWAALIADVFDSSMVITKPDMHTTWGCYDRYTKLFSGSQAGEERPLQGRGLINILNERSYRRTKHNRGLLVATHLYPR